jgi:hypothetical protein
MEAHTPRKVSQRKGEGELDMDAAGYVSLSLTSHVIVTLRTQASNRNLGVETVWRVETELARSQLSKLSQPIFLRRDLKSTVISPNYLSKNSCAR